jgi:hypothetical protein
MNQFPPSPWYEYPIISVSIFLNIREDICSSTCNTGVVDTGGRWKKSSIKEVSIIFKQNCKSIAQALL